MDTKEPLNPASDGNFELQISIDDFSDYIITVPAPKTIAQNNGNAIFHHRIFNPNISSPIFNWFLAIERIILQIFSKIYRTAFEKSFSFAYKMPNPHNMDRPLPLASFLKSKIQGC